MKIEGIRNSKVDDAYKYVYYNNNNNTAGPHLKGPRDAVLRKDARPRSWTAVLKGIVHALLHTINSFATVSYKTY